jgi:hypothetical protein
MADARSDRPVEKFHAPQGHHSRASDAGPAAAEDLYQVFHNEQQMVRVARAWLEREVFIEGPGTVVLGVHE